VKRTVAQPALDKLVLCKVEEHRPIDSVEAHENLGQGKPKRASGTTVLDKAELL